MSAWEGSGYQAKREDEGKPLFDKEIPDWPSIPEADMKIIWERSCVWNDDLRPHFFKGMCLGYLLCKTGKAPNL